MDQIAIREPWPRGAESTEELTAAQFRNAYGRDPFVANAWRRGGEGPS